jgi:Flp pilus assembly secretin CpaC
MALGFARLFGMVVSATLLAAVVSNPAPSCAQTPDRLYITVDKSHLIAIPGEPFAKVSIANPSLVDLQVISPSQILLNGRSPGVTSLLLFYKNRIHNFDVVVQPGPVLSTATPMATQEPHGVLVHRADRVSERLFLRDSHQGWIELGTVRAEPEAPRK